MQENDKIIIVPDVHGRTFWRDVLDAPDTYKVVFLGDYMDPYGYEGITYKMAVKEFRDIIEFKKANMDRVVLLIGNHMAHYVGLSNDTARYDYYNATEIYNLMKENEGLFQHAYRWHDTLFTHAGVTEGWLEQNELGWSSAAVANKLNENIHFSQIQAVRRFSSSYFAEHDSSPIGDIGQSRGGYAPSGGPLWADWDEDLSLDPAYDGELIQIVGHTQQIETGSVRKSKNAICCDSRACFVWDGKNISLLDISAI